MNAARNRQVLIVAGVAFALASMAAACSVDGTTPDCSAADSGCGVLADGSVISPSADAGDASADAVTDAPTDGVADASKDGANDARVDAAADAGPRDARAGG